MKAYVALASLILFGTACTTQPDQQGTQDTGSSLNSIDLKLPSKDGLAEAVAEKLSHYRMTITAKEPATFALAPVGSGSNPSFEVCKNIPISSTAANGSTVAETVNGLERVGNYASSDAIAAKIRTGCHYTVKLEVGNSQLVSQALRDAKGFDTYYVGEADVFGSSDNNVYSDGKIHVQITMNLAKDKAGSDENLPGSLVPADKDLEIEAKFGQGVEGDGQGVAALR